MSGPPPTEAQTLLSEVLSEAWKSRNRVRVDRVCGLRWRLEKLESLEQLVRTFYDCETSAERDDYLIEIGNLLNDLAADAV